MCRIYFKLTQNFIISFFPTQILITFWKVWTRELLITGKAKTNQQKTHENSIYLITVLTVLESECKCSIFSKVPQTSQGLVDVLVKTKNPRSYPVSSYIISHLIEIGPEKPIIKSTVGDHEILKI